MEWQLSKRLFKSARVIDFHGRRLKCFPDSTSTTAAIYFNGLADYWEMSFLRAYLRPGDAFLDVGANAGVYSILAAACVGERGNVEAFEPMDDMASRIEEQASLNGLTNLRVHRLVVGNIDGLVSFGHSSSDATRHIKREGETHSEGKLIKCVRLDEFKRDMQFDVGKMDIEGAEAIALEGSIERLEASDPPVWLLELAGYSNLYGTRSDEIVRLLSDRGFDCATYEPGSKELIRVNRPWELQLQNVLAISRAHWDQAQERVKESFAT